MAAAALAGIRTARLDSMRRGFENLLNTGAREAGLLLGNLGLDTFAFQHERQERGFAGTFVVRRQARQPITPVDEFVDGKSHSGSRRPLQLYAKTQF